MNSVLLTSGHGILTDGFSEEIRAYISEIMSIPMLSKEEEFSLAEKWKFHGDVSAANKLVTSHLKLVVKIASKYRWYGLSMIDIISEGTLGLMNAVKFFDHTKNFRLSTYAIWKIRASIQEYILKSWSIVKVATKKAHRKLFFGLCKSKRKVGIFESDSISMDSTQANLIAKDMDVNVEDVLEIESRMSNRDCSIESVDRDDSTKSFELRFPQLSVESSESLYMNNSLSKNRRESLKKAINNLSDREKEIVVSRFALCEPKTLEELGKKHGISAERVRQIQSSAMRKIKSQMLDLDN